MSEYPQDIRIFGVRKALERMDAIEETLREGREPAADLQTQERFENPQDDSELHETLAVGRFRRGEQMKRVPLYVEIEAAVGRHYCGLLLVGGHNRRAAKRRDSGQRGDHSRLLIGNWRQEFATGWRRPRQEYEKLHPNVRIVQEAIPEATYGQWMSTQLMGGTAPDIVQAGMVEGHLMTAFFTRYFLPLSGYVTRPNPYNAGTDLQKTPLIRTFKDGMRRSFIDETQEFMTIPLGADGRAPLLQQAASEEADRP